MQSILSRTIHVFIFIFLLYPVVRAQNLVANPSFEDVNTCAEYQQPCSPCAWFFLSRKFTTGYYPLYPSATGSRHLRMIVASRETPNRQYWETMLLCPLEAGKQYTISLKVASPGSPSNLDSVCPDLSEIGLWFTDRFIFKHGDSVLQPHNYLAFKDAAVKDLHNGWFELTKTFTPTHTAAIMMIGNFARATNAEIIQQKNPAGPAIEVLADDIAVIPAGGINCDNYQNIKDSLYSIIGRHAEDHPLYRIPLSDLAKDNQQEEEKTSQENSDDPDEDPLFGPVPRRPVNTPKQSPPPLKSDTIVIRDIHFDFDKYLIQNPDTLQRYKSLLTRPGIEKIQIAGFTDDAGSEAYNLDLSQKRAQEIARLLSSKFDISPNLIQSEGKGISRKYADPGLNRRVEIYVFHE